MPVPVTVRASSEAAGRGDLGTRLLVAAVGVPLCAAVVFAGGLVFAAGLAALAALAYREFAVLYQTEPPRPFGAPGLVGAALFPPVVLYAGSSGAWILTILLLMSFGGWGMARIPIRERPLAAAGLTSFGTLYVGGLLSLGVLLREGSLPAGIAGGEPGRLGATLFFFFPVVVTWLADTAAYFGGRRLGRRRLAPVVSPNKTIEGAVAALLAGPCAALLYAMLLLPGWRIGPAGAALFGLVIAGFAIVGDLVESALKRERAVKDSSNLLPGHGGLLDRLDSILWALPVAYLFFAARL